MDEYKLWYLGSEMNMNGFGILVDKKLRKQMVQVMTVNDRIMSIKLVIGGSYLNIVSDYAIQIGSGEKEKQSFWEVLDEMVSGVLNNDKLFIRGDFNGHIRSSSRGYDDVHGGFAFRERNERGDSFLDFSRAFGLMVANSSFTKKDIHLVIFHTFGVQNSD